MIYDEIRDEFGALLFLPYTNSRVRSEPCIYNGSRVSEVEIDSYERGYRCVRGLWTANTECVTDVRISNVDNTYYVSIYPKHTIKTGKGEEYKIPESFERTTQGLHSRFFSVDGLLVNDASNLRKLI